MVNLIRLVFSIIVFGTSAWVKAENIFELVTEEVSISKFQQLLDFAHYGRPALFNEAQGVYTGRCYYSINPSSPDNSALLILKIDATHDEGPLFPKAKISLIVEGGMSGPADRLDSKSKEELISLFLPLKSAYVSVTENPLSVVLNLTSSTSNTLSFIRYQNYIIGLVRANQDQHLLIRGKNDITIRKDEVWGACYYFNKK